MKNLARLWAIVLLHQTEDFETFNFRPGDFQNFADGLFRGRAKSVDAPAESSDMTIYDPEDSTCIWTLIDLGRSEFL